MHSIKISESDDATLLRMKRETHSRTLYDATVRQKDLAETDAVAVTVYSDHPESAECDGSHFTG